jgi:hypothetical protein
MGYIAVWSCDVVFRLNSMHLPRPAPPLPLYQKNPWTCRRVSSLQISNKTSMHSLMRRSERYTAFPRPWWMPSLSIETRKVFVFAYGCVRMPSDISAHNYVVRGVVHAVYGCFLPLCASLRLWRAGSPIESLLEFKSNKKISPAFKKLDALLRTS